LGSVCQRCRSWSVAWSALTLQRFGSNPAGGSTMVEGVLKAAGTRPIRDLYIVGGHTPDQLFPWFKIGDDRISLRTLKDPRIAGPLSRLNRKLEPGGAIHLDVCFTGRHQQLVREFRKTVGGEAPHFNVWTCTWYFYPLERVCEGHVIIYGDGDPTVMENPCGPDGCGE
jgi:hypothetical protein